MNSYTCYFMTFLFFLSIYSLLDNIQIFIMSLLRASSVFNRQLRSAEEVAEYYEALNEMEDELPFAEPDEVLSLPDEDPNANLLDDLDGGDGDDDDDDSVDCSKQVQLQKVQRCHKLEHIRRLTGSGSPSLRLNSSTKLISTSSAMEHSHFTN